ncbi:M13 family metallopeptidase [Pseudoduganella sp. R-34]|uniref:M13 family metallopeptidase n=1 Tax=Pseudoduganella sp. R-34 TaxID=3404062 RepID=UPI003CF2D66F
MKLLKLASLAVLASLAAQAGAAAPRIQDDLYRAVNGAWIETTTIPASRTESYGAELPDIVDQRVREIVEELSARPQRAGSIERKIGSYYAAYLDTGRIEKAGLAPVRPLLAEIDAIGNRRELARWMGRAQGRIETPLWLWGGFADFKDPTLNRVMMWQGGLGLPSRDYYLSPDDVPMAKARAAYREYLGALAALAGQPQPAAMAARVLALEQRIAAVQLPLAQARDPALMHNPMNARELLRHAPGIDWPAFMRAASMPADEAVTVAQLAPAKAIAALFAAVPLDDWKMYFKLRSLDEAAPVLPKAFRDARFAFRGRALGGLGAEAPRAESAIIELSSALSEPLSKVYVERHFPAAHKARVSAMVDHLLGAYSEVIADSSWMSAATREQALAKLSKYQAKIGYPEQWRDYAGLVVRDGDALGNRHRARRFEWEYKAAQAGKRMDRSAWAMSPIAVNAFYDPMLNEINLPAGLLQAPLFDMAADDAANYGGIGVQIAHEISHGFDSMGAQFDGDGVMRNWWTDADRKAFEEIGQRLQAQYARYEALPGKYVNGAMTLAENMADLAGLQVAFRAYQLASAGKVVPLVDGFSGEQRFFLNFAKSWRKKARDERVLQLLASDPHAPNEFRANGPAVNVDAFHEAFATKPGDAMFKPADERIRAW